MSILRDNDPAIVWPNHWDLPGGGIEPGETAEQALWREVHEEIGLQMAGTPFLWQAEFPRADGATSYFFAARITSRQINDIQLGSEGQRWDMMPIRAFCARTDAVHHFRSRVRDCFDQIGWP